MKSEYIHRQRTKGFNLKACSPDGREIVCCTRPGKWGNPYQVVKGKDGLFRVTFDDSELGPVLTDNEVFYSHYGATSEAVWRYRNLMEPIHDSIIQELKGKHLACWCKPGEPCHVQDVLLKIINK